MPRFSVDLPDKLNTWLQEQANDAQRTKNGQLVYLLEQIQHKTTRQAFFMPGYSLSCTYLRHYWRNGAPMENEECNCGKVRW